MKKYRKKPVVVEAVRWQGKNLDEIIKFCGVENIGPIERKIGYVLRIKVLGYFIPVEKFDYVTKMGGVLGTINEDELTRDYEEVEE